MSTSTSDPIEAQNTYLAERARQAAALRAVVVSICDALPLVTGTPWSYVQGDDFELGIYQHAEISGPDAQRLHIRRSHNHRLEIYGDFGDARTYRPRGENHEITVNAARRPVEIAREIARRLLPTYAPSLAKARAAHAAAAAREAAQQALADDLRALCNGINYHNTTTHFYFYSTAGRTSRRASSEVQVSSDMSITIKAADLTTEQARAILAIIAPADAA